MSRSGEGQLRRGSSVSKGTEASPEARRGSWGVRSGAEERGRKYPWLTDGGGLPSGFSGLHHAGKGTGSEQCGDGLRADSSRGSLGMQRQPV